MEKVHSRKLLTEQTVINEKNRIFIKRGSWAEKPAFLLCELVGQDILNNPMSNRRQAGVMNTCKTIGINYLDA